MKEVYLYFRTIAAIGDDDSSADSMCFPLSHFCGFVPTADDTLNIYFKPVIMKEKVQFDHDGDSTTSVKNDFVVVTLSSNNTHKDVITRLARLFSGAANGGIHHDGFIDVADDLTNTYAVAGIDSLSTISVTAS
tara:strand:- start:46 stop:447 length:402 start_codon:yes stop_codon:yes gene_type:complete